MARAAAAVVVGWAALSAAVSASKGESECEEALARCAQQCNALSAVPSGECETLEDSVSIACVCSSPERALDSRKLAPRATPTFGEVERVASVMSLPSSGSTERTLSEETVEPAHPDSPSQPAQQRPRDRNTLGSSLEPITKPHSSPPAPRDFLGSMLEVLIIILGIALVMMLAYLQISLCSHLIVGIASWCFLHRSAVSSDSTSKASTEKHNNDGGKQQTKLEPLLREELDTSATP